MLLLSLLACKPTQERADAVALGVVPVLVEILDRMAGDVADRDEPAEAVGTWTASPYGEGSGSAAWEGSAVVTLASGGEATDLCGAEPCASETFNLTIDMHAQILEYWGSCGLVGEPYDLDGTLAGTMAFERLPVRSVHLYTSYIIVADLAGTMTDGTGDLEADLRVRGHGFDIYGPNLYLDGTVGGRNTSWSCLAPS